MGLAQTPRSLISPPPPPTVSRLHTRWEAFLGEIASGTLLQDAMLKHYITRAEIETKCLVGAELTRWKEARHAAQRRAWSVLDIELVLSKIAGGHKVADAVAEVKPGAYDGFHAIVTSDPALNEQYLEALKMRAMHHGEEIIEMADDDENDTLDTGGKSGIVPNNANVNRSKLKVESRLKLLGALYSKVYGNKPSTQVNVQINHAEKLENARARAKEKRAIPSTRAMLESAIEATFTEVPPAAAKDDPLDITWMDG